MPRHHHAHKPTAEQKKAFKKHWKESGTSKVKAAHSFHNGMFTVGQFKTVHKHKKKK